MKPDDFDCADFVRCGYPPPCAGASLKQPVGQLVSPVRDVIPRLVRGPH